MTGPSIAELRAATQPASIFERDSGEHWAGKLYIRKASPYLTRLLIRTPITPNGVTWLMILSGVAAAGVLALPGVLAAAGAASLFTSFLREDAGLAAGIDACLRRHRLPRLPADLGLTDEQFAQAVIRAPDTRPDRFTILEHLALDEAAVRERVSAFVAAYS